VFIVSGVLLGKARGDDLPLKRRFDLAADEPSRPPKRQTEVSIVRIILAAGAAALALGGAAL